MIRFQGSIAEVAQLQQLTQKQVYELKYPSLQERPPLVNFGYRPAGSCSVPPLTPDPPVYPIAL